MPNILLYFFSRNPRILLGLGLLCTVGGIRLIIKAYQGDTLMPGTNFTYLPAWFFYTCGMILQIPLPLAWWFLVNTGYL